MWNLLTNKVRCRGILSGDRVPKSFPSEFKNSSFTGKRILLVFWVPVRFCWACQVYSTVWSSMAFTPTLEKSRIRSCNITFKPLIEFWIKSMACDLLSTAYLIPSQNLVPWLGVLFTVSREPFGIFSIYRYKSDRRFGNRPVFCQDGTRFPWLSFSSKPSTRLVIIDVLSA